MYGKAIVWEVCLKQCSQNLSTVDLQMIFTPEAQWVCCILIVICIHQKQPSFKSSKHVIPEDKQHGAYLSTVMLAQKYVRE